MKSASSASIVRRNIEKAKANDADAAKTLIKEFCATVNQNRQQEPDGTYKLNSDGTQKVDFHGNPIPNLRFKRNPDGTRVPHNKPSGLHTQFDEELLDYLVECFERIGEYVGDSGSQKRVTADVALNLSSFGKRGPKSSLKTREDSLLRGMRVWERHRNSEQSIEDICAELADIENQSQHTLESDYKLFNALLGNISGS
ncbi:hypothetical protein [Rhodoferax sp. GW822-FHT02A01]|uniref:hypothetical protein n=1 Tax=Rhodoferax sp. GW822-FHT02A01 TaxID=3141537 RepID=UPI00315CA787